MAKLFIDSSCVRDNALKLARKIHNDGFIPDIIYVSLRGGATIGNIISEYFKLLTTAEGGKPVYYAAVVARSYAAPQNQHEVVIDGWTYPPEHLRQGDRIMIIDDIFDSGGTVNRLVKIILAQGIPKDNIRVVVHDYKLRKYVETPPILPDYYCIKHEILKPEDDHWIHYLSHELQGLTKEEIERYFEGKELKSILNDLVNP